MEDNVAIFFQKYLILHSDIYCTLLSAARPIWINYSHLSQSTWLTLIDMHIFQLLEKESMNLKHWRFKEIKMYCDKNALL